MQLMIRNGVILTALTISALAVTVSDTFDVTATVSSSCTVSAPNLDFGAYDPTSGTPTDGTSTIAVYCTLLTPYDVNLSTGLSGDYTDRTMDNDANTSQLLHYNLYSDSGHSNIWGDGSTGGTVNVSGTGLGILSPSNHTVYGRITINQDVQPGTYRDTITATVSY